MRALGRNDSAAGVPHELPGRTQSLDSALCGDSGLCGDSTLIGEAGLTGEAVLSAETALTGDSGEAVETGDSDGSGSGVDVSVGVGTETADKVLGMSDVGRTSSALMPMRLDATPVVTKFTALAALTALRAATPRPRTDAAPTTVHLRVLFMRFPPVM